MINILLNIFRQNTGHSILAKVSSGIFIICSSIISFGQCNVEIQMNDSWGDGWNGGNLEIFFDGVSQGTFSAAGTGSTANLTIPAGQTMTVNYSSGSWENENTYTISIGGSVVFSDGTNPLTGMVYSYDCPGGGGGSNCGVVIQMNDSWGDGWNGGSLEIFFDGISQGTFSAAGTGSTANLTIPAGQTMTVNYSSGSWENENTYTISIGGSVVFSDGPNPSTGMVYSYDCPGGCSTPAPPTASNLSINCGEQGTLTTSGAPSNGDYNWYDDPNGTNQVGSGSSFTTPTLTGNTTYYVSVLVPGNCESSLVPVVINVDPIASPNVTGNTSICENQSTILTASGTPLGGDYAWYSDANGTNLIGTGNTYTTPTLNTNTTYYTQASNGNMSTTPASLNTTFTGGNGQNGNMFDINVLNSITINDFDVNANNGTGDFEVYYKTGSYNGFETNAGAWTLLGTATNVTSNGQGTPTPLNLNLNLQLAPGSYSFYITGTNIGVQYTNGTNNNNIYAQNSEIEFFEGVGKQYPFGATYSPRIWNGTIHYEIGTIASCLSSLTPITVTVNPAPIAPVLSGSSTVCFGESVTLNGAGGNVPPANWTWYENTVNGMQLGNGSNTTVSPSSTTNYLVEVPGNGGCSPAVSNTITVSLPIPDNTISGNNAQTTCRVAQNGYVHFLDSNGKLIASINSNGQNLGEVSAISFVEGTPLQVPDCSGSIFTSVLDRHWVITPEFQPSSPVEVVLPLSTSEEQSLIQEANSNNNPNDDLGGLGNIVLTKYAGPNNIDNLFPNNCLGQGGNETLDLFNQTNSGYVSDYWPTYTGQDLFTSFTISSFSEFWLHGTSNNSPLPVTMNYFNVDCENQATVINWETASEQNSSHFNLQKSRDGQTWETIYTTNAAGNTNSISNYSFEDIDAGNDINYYRLAQFDFDGQNKIYGPISSQCQSQENSINVYPNPSDNDFVVVLNSSSDYSETTIILLDLNGRIIINREIQINAGQNAIHFKNTQLVPGSYLVKLSGTSETFKHKKLIIN